MEGVIDLVVMVSGGVALYILAVYLYAGFLYLIRPMDEDGCRENVYKVPK